MLKIEECKNNFTPNKNKINTNNEKNTAQQKQNSRKGAGEGPPAQNMVMSKIHRGTHPMI